MGGFCSCRDHVSVGAGGWQLMEAEKALLYEGVVGRDIFGRSSLGGFVALTEIWRLRIALSDIKIFFFHTQE